MADENEMFPKDMKIPEYRQAVDELFSIKSDAMIPNSSVLHAAVINEMILKHTPRKGNVYLLCRDLARNCFEDQQVLNEAQKAVDRNIKFHIAYTNRLEAEKFLNIVGKQNMFHVKPLMAENVEVNFTTNGEAVRMEWDASVPHADVVAFAPEAAEKIISLFNQLERIKD